ncbi:MAG TPA: type I secretion C-terminal target domain-containing protein, partial [Burkholderiales bacterium]|nr:type I secretion C-terminal target domain-containing protein [Burkholderiales bacterium]
IYGGLGADILSGGSGWDFFHYSNLSDGGADEWITDFTLGWNGDVLHLSELAWNNPGFVADADHLSFTQVDSNSDGFIDYTSVGVDLDGGVDNFVTLVNLEGVSMSLADSANLVV